MFFLIIATRIHIVSRTNKIISYEDIVISVLVAFDTGRRSAKDSSRLQLLKKFNTTQVFHG